MKIFSIVGTDTEIGKTHATVEIINYLNDKSYKAFALKPIAAGLDKINGKLINDDVYRIASANHSPIPENIISPLQFKLAIAPHIAAQYQQAKLNTPLVINKIQSSIDSIKNLNTLHHSTSINKKPADYILIEGVGGIMVPLNESETYLNVLQQLKHPVILVVGMKLGCLNHALLTYSTLTTHNVQVDGWIANCITPNMPYLKENIEYLERAIRSPLLATIPYKNKIETTTKFKEIFSCI